MNAHPDPWCVLLAVAPPLLEELLSGMLGRVDFSVSTLSSLSPSSVPARFDVGVVDHSLPPWVDVDQVVRIRADAQNAVEPIQPFPGEPVIDDVDSLRHELAQVCPSRLPVDRC